MAFALSAYEQEDREALLELYGRIKLAYGGKLPKMATPPRLHSMFDYYRDKQMFVASVGEVSTQQCDTVEELAKQVVALLMLGE